MKILHKYQKLLLAIAIATGAATSSPVLAQDRSKPSSIMPEVISAISSGAQVREITTLFDVAAQYGEGFNGYGRFGVLSLQANYKLLTLIEDGF